MRCRVVALAALALALAGPAASSDGGPSPGAVYGGEGVVAANGGIRWVALTAGSWTIVEAVEVDGGRILGSQTVRGAYGIPLVAYDGTTGGLSADGSTLVLSPFAAPPSPGSISRFVVFGTDRFRVRRVIALHGTYSFDAISPRGSTIYFVQYTSTQNWNRYRVRAYDVGSGWLLPGAIVDRREPGEKMQGAPVTRVSTRDGGWAYTLYARGSATAFVHALDTRHRAAFCIDLPWGGSQQSLNGIHMRVGHGRLVLSDYAGRLAAVDTKTLRVSAFRAP